MLPLQIEVAIDNRPCKSLLAGASDSIRERPQTGPGLPVVANVRQSEDLYMIQDDLVNAGAKWVDSEAVVDRNWVSSRQPGDIPKFNEKMKELFWGGARQQPRAKAAFQ